MLPNIKFGSRAFVLSPEKAALPIKLLLSGDIG